MWGLLQGTLAGYTQVPSILPALTLDPFLASEPQGLRLRVVHSSGHNMGKIFSRFVFPRCCPSWREQGEGQMGISMGALSPTLPRCSLRVLLLQDSSSPFPDWTVGPSACPGPL